MTFTRICAGALIAVCAMPAARGQPAVDTAAHVRIETSRDGEFVTVAASAGMQVSPRVAWEVLSDYDHLADFIPDISSSRVVSRDGNNVVVAQKGKIGFFFYKQPIDVTLSVIEDPPSRITARAAGGNIRELETRYELKVSDSGTTLAYAGRFIPAFSIPPVIGMPLLRLLIERRFRAMVDEILRRDLLARAPPTQ